MFRLGLRRKIFVVTLILISGVVLASGLYLQRQLRTWLEQRIDDELLHHAKIGGKLLEESLADAGDLAGQRARLDELAETLAVDTDTRVTIVDAQGQVVGDSQLNRDRTPNRPDYSSRPEIVDALRSPVGRARRVSTTSSAEMLHVAVAFGEPSPRGAIRVSATLSDVEAAIARLRVLLTIAGALGLILAAASSGLASQLLARRLERLVEQTRARHGHGPTDADLEHAGSVAIGTFGRLTRELDRAVERVGTERDRLDTILQSMQEAVLALDDQNRISLANTAAHRLFSRTSKLAGHALTDVVRVPDLVDLVARTRDEPQSGELTLPGPPIRRVLAHVAPLRAQPGRVLVLHDVSETRRLEQVRRDFVANVSHELRTPVSIIAANAETLLAGALSDEDAAKNFVDAISRNASRLAALIRDLLDLSRIEAGRYPLELRTISLEHPVRRAVEALGEQSAVKKIDLSFACEIEAAARSDSAACEQVAVNLVENAVKYTPAHGHVWVRLVDADDDVRVEIEDDGPGLAPQHRQRVFERFYRVDPGRSREMGGTGLGLSIVKHLVDAMGGQIGFRPSPTGGSVFWFAMPKPPQDDDDTASDSRSSS
ncbi:MAG: PAS domain-containing protein [Myxococcales bacterium FL481]|nr:MAG: PAS domain-containing protein [Myxococcales bacterium FL481]